MSTNNIYLIILLIFFLMSIFTFYLYCKKLRKHHIGQTVRLEGPKEHYKKNNTPVMGGIIFISYFIVTSLLHIKIFNINIKNNILSLFIIYIPLLFNFFIGLIDDLKIIKNKSNDGLSSRLKFFLQLISSIIVYIVLLFNNYSTEINFFGYYIDLRIFYYFFILFLYLAFPNSVNLTDGIDGLASGVSIIILIFLSFYALFIKNYLIFNYTLIFLIFLFSFYIFNIKKAWLFMGDSGSLAIGSFLCSVFILLKIEVLIIFMGVIFIIETLSVIIQVSYFKLTKGRRLFKMAPIHHHLELCGFNENQINLIFYSVTFVFCLFGFSLGVKLF